VSLGGLSKIAGASKKPKEITGDDVVRLKEELDTSWKKGCARAKTIKRRQITPQETTPVMLVAQKTRKALLE
jgi:hypothetical protein